MVEAETEPPVRRRRRKSSRKKAASWPEYWRSSDFGRHLFIAMCLLGAAYAGKILWDTRMSTFLYQSLWLDATENDVRYMLGAPDAVAGGGSVYRYVERGRTVTVTLAPNGETISIKCTAAEAPPATCGSIRGIRVGTTEDQVLMRLGAPSRVSFSGNDKTMHYDGLGMTFQLRLFRVRELEVRKGPGLTGYFPKALWAMFP